MELILLSDEILLEILHNLDSSALYYLSLTCTRFQNLVKEKKLWVHFDFQAESLTATDLIKRMHFLNHETRSFRIRGLANNYPFNSWDNPTITANMLTMLADSCPSLSHLSIFEGFVNFNKLNIQNFPPSLRRLELNRCEVPMPKMPQMFFHRIDTHMCHLEELCLEESYWFETHDLVLFSKMPALRLLNLRGSNSVTHCVPYASIASRYGFKQLEVLDLRNTPVSDSDIQCFNVTSTLKELLLECPEKLRRRQGWQRRQQQQQQSQKQKLQGGSRKRKTSQHQSQYARSRGGNKKRRISDTEESSSRSDRPQESTENDDEDSSSDSCTRTRSVKCLRTGGAGAGGNSASNDVISITVRCDQRTNNNNSSSVFQAQVAAQPTEAGEGPSHAPAALSSNLNNSPPAAINPQVVGTVPGPSAAAAAAAPLPPPNNNNMPQVEIRQNGQSVRLNPIVIHNNSAIGPIIIISGPPPAQNTMRQMRIQVFKHHQQKARARRIANRASAAGAGPSGSNNNNNNNNKRTDDSVEGDDEEEWDDDEDDHEDDDEDPKGTDEDYDDQDEDDDDDDPEEDHRSTRPGFNTPGPLNLITDRGICAFGVSPNNVMPNWIWIRAEARKPNTNIERLVVRDYKQVTDTSLSHLKQCTPNLRFLDVSGTSVTKEAVEQFRLEKPDCVVVADV